MWDELFVQLTRFNRLYADKKMADNNTMTVQWMMMSQYVYRYNTCTA